MSLQPSIADARIAVIGLGYVGLPLAVAFSKRYPTVGFDLSSSRIDELKQGRDSTGEVSDEELSSVNDIRFSSDESDLRECNVFIVAVPTPIDNSRKPNLAPLISASRIVGRAIAAGDIVVYESTVYPGATEEDCLPVVEEESGLTYNQDFFAGYSPERINPGDKERTLSKIVKVTSGSTPEAAEFVDQLYKSIVTAGTFLASSIRVAEASKIIENTQRDVNIALINELSIIFSHLGIDTNEVIAAAATKWNFVKLTPGLVGGHCIGVDPYYLVHKSMASGYIPDIIRQSREINDGMPRNVAARLIKAMIQRDLPIKGARVLLAGFTFKENCPDTRNTKVVELMLALQEYGIDVDICDTWAIPEEVSAEYGLSLKSELPDRGAYSAVILTVPHRDMVEAGPARLRTLMRDGGILFDLKAVFEKDASDLRL